MSIRIITDSAADFTAQELKKREVDLVPMSVVFGEETYQDGIDLTKDTFYEKLKDLYPKTSQPSPAAFLERFEDAKKGGDTVIAILISGALSGTVQSAQLAKDMAEYSNIYIIDSKTATLGMRILVNTAVQMRREGADAKSIVNQLEMLKTRIKIFAGLDTLEYLAKGGRIPRSVASVGNFANIKPTITITRDGKVELIGKQIGMLRAYRQLAKLVEENEPDKNYPVYHIYSQDKKNCAGFVHHLEKKGIDCGTHKLFNIGPTIGSHIGPGAFGIVYVK